MAKTARGRPRSPPRSRSASSSISRSRSRSGSYSGSDSRSSLRSRSRSRSKFFSSSSSRSRSGSSRSRSPVPPRKRKASPIPESLALHVDQISRNVNENHLKEIFVNNNGAKTEEKQQTRYKGKHDKDKPWDDPSIDHWKIEKFDPSWNEPGMLEISSFSTLFPQYREKYLQECWPIVKGSLKEHEIACELNLVEGCMTVSTTKKTRDPYIIVKARDLIKLLSRSVAAPQAIKILNDEMQCDIIKIGNLVRNKERFVKRRQHLVGPNSSTLKALEILTGCYILVQGNTVASMGSFKGLKQVRKVVEECILNKMHPVYNIKILMMKRELAKDPSLANENWDRFLPSFKKKNVNQKKVKTREKKPYTPFPPPHQPSKMDLQLESGEYFLSDKKKQARKWQDKQEKQAEKTAESKRKREEAFVPPEEPKRQGPSSLGAEKSDVATIALSLKIKAKEFGRQKSVENFSWQSSLKRCSRVGLHSVK